MISFCHERPASPTHGCCICRIIPSSVIDNCEGSPRGAEGQAGRWQSSACCICLVRRSIYRPSAPPLTILRTASTYRACLLNYAWLLTA